MRIDVYVGEAPDEGDGYGGATDESTKISIGTVRKDKVSGSTQAHGEHGHFASGSGDGDLEKVPEFKTKGDAEKWFSDKGIRVLPEVTRMRSINPEALHVVAESLVRMNAKFPGLMDEIKVIAKCPSNDAVASVADRRYGGYNRLGQMLRQPEGDGSKLTLSPTFGHLVSDPEYLAEFIKVNEGYNTLRTPQDAMTHELTHAVMNMTDADNGIEPSFPRLMAMREWSRPSEVQDAVTAAYGRSPAMATVREQMAKDIGSDYSKEMPAEFVAEVNVIIGNPERFGALPDDVQERLRTFQTEMNKRMNHDVIKTVGSDLGDDDIITSEIIDDFGMPKSFWDWSKQYIGDDDEPAEKISIGRLAKDRVSGQTQAHGAHGHFASGGDGGENEGKTRLGRLRDILGGRSKESTPEPEKPTYPTPKPTKDPEYFQQHAKEIADRAYPPGSRPLSRTPTARDLANPAYEQPTPAQKADGDKFIREMAREQWGDIKPTVLTPEEFDQYVRDHGSTVIYRGFGSRPPIFENTPEEQEATGKRFRDPTTEERTAAGDRAFQTFLNAERLALGVKINGDFFGVKDIGMSYGKVRADENTVDPARGRVVQAVLKPDAEVRTVQLDSLDTPGSLATALGRLADPDGSKGIRDSSASVIAASLIAQGIDAVRIPGSLSGGASGTFTVILNSGALIVAGDNGTTTRR